MKFIRNIFLFVTFGLMMGLLLSYVSPIFHPQKMGVIGIIGLFYPLLLLANIAMLLFWLFVKPNYMLLPLSVIILGWNYLTGFVNFSSISKPTTASIDILSYNLGFTYFVRKVDKARKEANIKGFKAFLQKNKDVEIFCMQETDKFSIDILKTLYPTYHAHEVKNKGTFIFSKFPFVNTGEIEFGTETNSCVWADVVAPSDTIRIYCTHLRSNKISKDADLVIDNANIQEKKTWVGIRDILHKYNTTSKIRAEEVRKILEHANSCPFPTFIVGDLNEPPTSYIYDRISDNFQDSFKAAGSGIGTTYGGKIPMLRIDYIFASEDFKVENFKVLKEKYSDHFPIRGQYLLKAK